MSVIWYNVNKCSQYYYCPEAITGLREYLLIDFSLTLCTLNMILKYLYLVNFAMEIFLSTDSDKFHKALER